MLLKKGSKGEDVKKLQLKLGVEAIGTFGPKTEAAVKAWQKANGLNDDGVVGDATWNKLFGANVIKEDVSIKKDTSIKEKDESFSKLRDRLLIKKQKKEDNSDDIAWCKQFFGEDGFIFSEGQDQIDDYARIMSCDHNILSHASSFGWWAAYVNPNPNKIVVAPEWYHPDEPTLKREKFYPNSYILC